MALEALTPGGGALEPPGASRGSAARRTPSQVALEPLKQSEAQHVQLRRGLQLPLQVKVTTKGLREAVKLLGALTNEAGKWM